MQFEHECAEKVYDAPSAEVTLRIGDRTHTYRDPTGGGMCLSSSESDQRIHRAGFELMAAIDEACRVEQWIGTTSERKDIAR